MTTIYFKKPIFHLFGISIFDIKKFFDSILISVEVDRIQECFPDNNAATKKRF